MTSNSVNQLSPSSISKSESAASESAASASASVAFPSNNEIPALNANTTTTTTTTTTTNNVCNDCDNNSAESTSPIGLFLRNAAVSNSSSSSSCSSIDEGDSDIAPFASSASASASYSSFSISSSSTSSLAALSTTITTPTTTPTTPTTKTITNTSASAISPATTPTTATTTTPIATATTTTTPTTNTITANTNANTTPNAIQAPDDDEYMITRLEPGQKGLLMHLLSQLRIGMDLTRVTIPSYFLEPRSLLERLTDFTSHPQLIIEALEKGTAVERMVATVKWYVSGWHVRPKGVKKPYNPILGEFFRSHHELPDHSLITYFAEQVSHHPPVSAFYGQVRRGSRPESLELEYSGWYYPRSKFLGNSMVSLAEGVLQVYSPNLKERYVCTWPSLYARGILFGSMLMEMGGKTVIECKETGLITELEFKTKGLWGGEYNILAGKIRTIKGRTLYTFQGRWDRAIMIRKHIGGSSDADMPEEVLFDARKNPIMEKIVPPIEEQEPNESRRQWLKVSEAIGVDDLDLATHHKSLLEQAQREARETRETQGIPYVPKYFRKVEDDEFWVPVDKQAMIPPQFAHLQPSTAVAATTPTSNTNPAVNNNSTPSVQ